ncbi:MAG: cytochrome C oxidase subunit IV family protein [Bacteroidia bacterium]|nr:cytochrome C oxidase subunit IV family protein [Bacteroidia bacterium]NNC84757.1 cytochrome C oxidase subunit IV family protein [Bacteroidia bacterium]
MADEHNEEHGYYTGDVHNQFVPEHHDPKGVSKIWKTFWILLIATAVEVAIGVYASAFPRTLLIWIFVVLTIFKAYYIVAVFMHLKGETVPMKYSIILPFVFIIYLIVLALIEANFIHLMDK